MSATITIHQYNYQHALLLANIVASVGHQPVVIVGRDIEEATLARLKQVAFIVNNKTSTQMAIDRSDLVIVDDMRDRSDMTASFGFAQEAIRQDRKVLVFTANQWIKTDLRYCQLGEGVEYLVKPTGGSKIIDEITRILNGEPVRQTPAQERASLSERSARRAIPVQAA